MDLGRAERMLYSSGVLTLNNAITMFCDVYVENTHRQSLLLFQTKISFYTNTLLMQTGSINKPTTVLMPLVG